MPSNYPSLVPLITHDQDEIQAIDEHLPDPKQRPIQHKLMSRLRCTLESMVAIMKKQEALKGSLRESFTAEEVRTAQELRSQYKRLLDESEELYGWTNPQRIRLVDLGDDVIGDFLQASGYRYSQISGLLHRIHAKRIKAGRPTTTRRVVSVKALELSRKHPKWTALRLAENVCDCGGTHTHKCADNLRKGMEELEMLLQKYGL